MTKGFTLVELLAVIVILAVLALIATPVVLSIIDDAKESAMLRSAEMYLSGVENAVMRENMNSGGNFRPNECTITNGNMICDSTNVEVEVDGEVPSTGSIVFENGKIIEATLNYESGTIVKDISGNLEFSDEENETGKVEYTAYVVGDEVTIGGENFYVIADSDATQEKVTLLAKYNLNKEGTVQLNATMLETACVFSNTQYWPRMEDLPEGLVQSFNLNEYPIPEGVTSVITTAKTYGASKGGTGRLMTEEEARILITNYEGIIYGTNIDAIDGYLNYYLSIADSEGINIVIEGWDPGIDAGAWDTDEYWGVRPVVEISKNRIS